MSQSSNITESFDPKIPDRIVIGVTGHRELQDETALGEKVRLTLENIKKLVPARSRNTVTFCVLSPLAEGADRLVANEVLKLPKTQLEVVLPLEKDEYLRDFKTPESREQFEHLLLQAQWVKRLPSTASRTEAYAQAGRYVIDHSDVVIALWNGKLAAGQGGTAEIVQYARDTKCPLFWIQTDDPYPITEELGRGLERCTCSGLDEYSPEPEEIDEIKQRTRD